MAMARAGADVLQLGVGEPGFSPPPQVVEALGATVAAGDTHYTDRRGRYSLREAIAAAGAKFAKQHLHTHGVACYWWQLLSALAELEGFRPRSERALGFRPV